MRYDAGANNVNLKKSIVILTVVAVFIILMAVFALVSFPIADTVYDYHGYATTIKLGLDLSGGVSAVFDVQPDGYGDLETRVDGTVTSLQDMLVSEGYTEAVVTKTRRGDNFAIRVEVPDVNNADDVLDLIGRPAKLQFVGATSAGEVGSALPADAVVAVEGGRHLSSAFVTMQNGDFAVGLEFNEEGTKAFADLTSNYSYVHIYINGELFSNVQVQSEISDGRAIITSESWAEDYNAASEFATQLQAGAFGVTLSAGEVRNISPSLGDDAVRVVASKPLKHTHVKTLPYPGFPTDMQPQIVVALGLSKGTSIVTESIFENRFRYVEELIRMGANIKVEGTTAIIEGVSRYTGASINAPDLRAGAALVIAALAAEGMSVVDDIRYIERGYEDFHLKLQKLGAQIEKVETDRELQKFRLKIG